MAKCKRKGVEVPDFLDPSKRSRNAGKHLVQDGPVTNEPILVGHVPFDVVVMEESQPFVMLEDGHTVEIVQENSAVTVVETELEGIGSNSRTELNASKRQKIVQIWPPDAGV